MTRQDTMTDRPASRMRRLAVLASFVAALAACSSSGSPSGGGGEGVAALSLGFSFSCARSSGGAVKCWGGNGGGQLGLGTLDPALSVTPVPVPTLSGVTALGAGEFHACAVAGGAVKCWGDNETGQIGLDPATFTSSATPVTVTGAAGATALAGGALHTCALMSDRRVKCWGYDADGELGVAPPPSHRADPVYVTSVTDAVSLAAGSTHTCAVLGNGRVKCWGGNEWAQLGDATLPNGHTGDHSADPVFAGSLVNAVQVAAGEGHTCARLSTGKVACWGINTLGVLGHAGGGGPDPVELTSLSGATAIASGTYHVCALVAGGPVKCWGDNFWGQLGNAAVGSSTPDPVTVTGVSGATAIAAGNYHTCAILAGGGVRCWGRNDRGQLGGGTPFAGSF